VRGTIDEGKDVVLYSAGCGAGCRLSVTIKYNKVVVKTQHFLFAILSIMIANYST
jgi:hypothetical protein